MITRHFIVKMAIDSTTMDKTGTQNGQPESTNFKQTIREISAESVKIIAAAQKISNIETALKELIENSIDAGATNIEIRLMRFGIDCIEVYDNGLGIEENDFTTLAQRYHTSKIDNYKTLQESLTTFGFRGEALSCLCKIANVTIVTRAKSSATGRKLIFNDGTLTSSETAARDVGTTVIVKNLFSSMPVRRRELETGAKRQYDRVVKLIYEQVLARPHIKFSLFKKTHSKKVQDFSHGGTSLEGCIITIYGIKVMETLRLIEQPFVGDWANHNNVALKVDERDCFRVTRSKELVPKVIETSFASNREFYKRTRKSKFAREKPEYLISGYISKIGAGRNSTDCQFIYVNKKACDIPKVSRTINEIYRKYSNQYPFYCLFVQVQSWAADFNVPCKREVILQDENKLVIVVEETLEKMFSPIVPAKQRSCSAAHIPVAPQLPKEGLLTIKLGSKREFEPYQDGESDIQPTKRSHQTNTSPLKLLAIEGCDGNSLASLTPEFVTPSSDLPEKTDEAKVCVSKPQMSEVIVLDDRAIPDPRNNIKSNYFIEHTSHKSAETNVPSTTIPLPQPNGFITALECYKSLEANKANQLAIIATNDEPEQQVDHGDSLFQQVKLVEERKLKAEIYHPEELNKALLRDHAQRKTVADTKEFSFAIHPNFNTVAEQELKLNLNKNSFENMRIIGQFNKGFIVTLLNKHLFIIDQHATDERANYEDQLDKSPLEKQIMVRPKPIYLNTQQENVVSNHIDAFKMRGFEFSIDKEKMPGFRVLLTATSVCKGQGIDAYLAKEDIEELVDVIIESPNNLSNYTLKKVKNIAAMRACRKSVMIGEPLTFSQMESIVAKMSTLRNPWICAHGRPTIRHLMDTDWF